MSDVVSVAAGTTSTPLSKNGRQFLVSVKWQQVSGTAEQKVPFEVICLVEPVGDDLWRLRERFRLYQDWRNSRIL